MGLLNTLFGNIKFSSTASNTTKHRPVHRQKHYVKTGYIIHTNKSADCNGSPIKTFTSGHNASSFARAMAKKWHTTVYVYKVDLNHYSLGTGDDLGTARYGVFSVKQYN